MKSVPAIMLLLVAIPGAATVGAQQAYVNFEGRQVSPIRLSPGGSRLFAVNTPDARLSVFDVSDPSNPILIAEIPVGIEPVSVNAPSEEEAWVVNEISDSVSIVSASRRLVTDTIHVKDEPGDVAFARGRAFVTVSGNNEVRVFDVVTHAQLAVIPVFGSTPRALAVSPDASRAYAVFASSGNRTTIIPASLAPPQPPPTGITNPPPRVGLIVDAADTNWSHTIKYTLPDYDVVEIDTDSLSVKRYFSRVGTINFGIAVRPTNGDLFVANTEARNRIRFEPNLRGRPVDNRVTRIETSGGAVSPFDLNPGIDHSRFPSPADKRVALAQPTAVVFDPSGNSLHVAAFGTDRVARMDVFGNVLSRIEIGPAVDTAVDPRTKRGPRGLALHPAARRLYVLNRISNTISVVDTLTDSVIRELPVGSHDPTPGVIRNGRGFLYDAKLSGYGTTSCASCHADADTDGMAWDLGDPRGSMQTVITSAFTHQMHPMKGPMVTQTLRGLTRQGQFHWRGDRRDFLAFNQNFESLMAGTILPGEDMASFRDFIETIMFAPNPNQKLDRSLPSAFGGGNPAAGNDFFRLRTGGFMTCLDCHHANPVPVSHPEILPADFLAEPQPFKIPHLRNLYQKTHFNNAPGAASISGFGLTHDGAEPGLSTFLSIHSFREEPIDPVNQANLNALMQCFDTGMAPAVGYTLTITPLNVDRPEIDQQWALLENQVASSNIDLVVKGTLDRTPRGLLFRTGVFSYRSDKAGVGPFNRYQLAAKVRFGDILSIMGVPPGSGVRMGIDRDLDGVLDGDVTAPSLQIVRAGSTATLSWPVSPVGFVLESASALSESDWAAETSIRQVVADRLTVAITPSAGVRFYRLRSL